MTFYDMIEVPTMLWDQRQNHLTLIQTGEINKHELPKEKKFDKLELSVLNELAYQLEIRFYRSYDVMFSAIFTRFRD